MTKLLTHGKWTLFLSLSSGTKKNKTKSILLCRKDHKRSEIHHWVHLDPFQLGNFAEESL